jgi:anhydro-N-acetylmuramic acid kinase
VIVAGVMSGTSADGINVAVVRITGGATPGGKTHAARAPKLKVELLGHSDYPFKKPVRNAILAAMNAQQASVADLARLNFVLGELYADAVWATAKKLKVKLELVGCHGQTIYHQGEAGKFLGKKLAVTWQTGEGAVFAARLGVPVVSDFRPADMAAGGKGAPLVPFLDYLLYRDRRIGRVGQNIGGIANLTAIPAGATPEQVIAFDTGPGNMVMDAVTSRLFGKPYDRDGRNAAEGKVSAGVLREVLRQPFFSMRPPKTAGREEFGHEFVGDFLGRCHGASKEDVVATATALTAHSIADALRRFVLVGRRGRFGEMVISGGGAKNRTLMSMLAAELRPLGLQLRFSDEFGIPAEAKEAVAFAVLAYQTWHRAPGNIPSATGARHPAILGKISYA